MDEKKKDEKKKKIKEKRKAKTEKQIEDVQKELDDLVKDMKVVMGDDVPNIKISDFTKKKLTRKNLYFSLIEIVVSLVVLIALTGFFNWFEYRKLFYTFIMFGGIILIEFILNIIIKRFLIKIYIYSFGLIKIVPTIIGFVLACLFAPGITIISIGKAILVFVLYVIVKTLTMYFIEGGSIKIVRR